MKRYRVPGLTAALALAALGVVSPLQASNGLETAIVAIESCDYPRALQPLRVAAAEGDRDAQRLLGFMLLHGAQLYRGVDVDRPEAIAWLRKASAQGDEQAAWVIARIERELTADRASVSNVGSAPLSGR